LSERQSLSEFLKWFNIDKVDLVYATEVFQYLPPDVFGEVINTVSKKLNLGGQLFCSRFSGVPSEVMSDNTNYDEDNREKVVILNRERGDVSVDFLLARDNSG
jgi:predicted TPR repeat methyltransferase